MTLRWTTLRWVVLALAGIAIAAGVSYAASLLGHQKVALSSEPLSAGVRLAPKPARAPARPARRHRRRRHHRTQTAPAAPPVPTQTVAPAPPVVPPAPVRPAPQAQPTTTPQHTRSGGREHEHADD